MKSFGVTRQVKRKKKTLRGRSKKRQIVQLALMLLSLLLNQTFCLIGLTLLCREREARKNKKLTMTEEEKVRAFRESSKQ